MKTEKTIDEQTVDKMTIENIDSIEIEGLNDWYEKSNEVVIQSNEFYLRGFKDTTYRFQQQLIQLGKDILKCSREDYVDGLRVDMIPTIDVIRCFDNLGVKIESKTEF